MWNFLVTVVLVTASGALAPGPLFFVTLFQGAKTGAKSGLIISVAHTLVEFTLVQLFAQGLLPIIDQPLVKFFIGGVGGLVLIVLGILQIRSSLRFEHPRTDFKYSTSRNLLLLGLILTGLNPYFIIWWLTVGANLIILALEFNSLYGVLLMYICHIWIDYVWLILVAYFGKKGIDFLGLKWYRIGIGVFGVILIIFGVMFLKNSFFYR